MRIGFYSAGGDAIEARGGHRTADVQNDHGDTALSCAADFGNLLVGQLLLDANARTDLRNLGGMSPMECAELRLTRPISRFQGRI
eukprot:3559693-Prymnesium_polylepis.1